MTDRVTARKPLRWPHLCLAACLMLARRPDALLHPQFWAEDGTVFYHDAYQSGFASLWTTRDGYLQSFSRIISLLAVQFPLASGPAIFAAAAAAFQLLPVALILSPRLDAALPSWPGRLILVYFFVAIPNAYELNFNVTNTQWHLAIASLLILCAGAPARAAARRVDFGFLLIAGLSGPFSIFLAPIAWAEFLRNGAPAQLRHALLITATAAVQLVCIMVTHAATARRVTPLGASLLGFCKIVNDNIVLGGLIGDHLMRLCLAAPFWQAPAVPAAITTLAFLYFVSCLRNGPHLLRAAAFFAACIFAAALFSPVSSAHENALQWKAMARPGYGMRYAYVPSLVWFGAALAGIGAAARPLRLTGLALFSLAIIGAAASWPFPRLAPTGFSNAAAAFARAPRGTIAAFPENPPGWTMILTKQ